MNAPAYPNVGTMPSRALALLLQGVAITHREFWIHAGTYRLSAAIHPLRKDDWDIQDTPEVVPTSDPTKRRAHIKRYYLPNEAISAAGEAGRDYVWRVPQTFNGKPHRFTWEYRSAQGEPLGYVARFDADGKKGCGALLQAHEWPRLAVRQRSRAAPTVWA